MNAVKVIADVDQDHQLSARVPETIPPGSVTVLIVPASQQDEAGDAWMASIPREWVDEWSDPAQDIYTLADGEAVDEA